MPTKAELEERLEEAKRQLGQVVDVLLDTELTYEETVEEALAVADVEVVNDDDCTTAVMITPPMSARTGLPPALTIVSSQAVLFPRRLRPPPMTLIAHKKRYRHTSA